MKESMVTVLRKDFFCEVRNGPNKGMRTYPKMSDYRIVPRISTYGTFTMAEIVPFEHLAKLARLRDQLAGIIRRKG